MIRSQGGKQFALGKFSHYQTRVILLHPPQCRDGETEDQRGGTNPRYMETEAELQAEHL